jgi:hypothetical protein
MPRLPLSHLAVIVSATLFVGCATKHPTAMDRYGADTYSVSNLHTLHRLALAAVRRDKPIHHPSPRFDDMEFNLGTTKQGTVVSFHPVVYIQSLEYLRHDHGQVWGVTFQPDLSAVADVTTMGAGTTHFVRQPSGEFVEVKRR